MNDVINEQPFSNSHRSRHGGMSLPVPWLRMLSRRSNNCSRSKTGRVFRLWSQRARMLRRRIYFGIRSGFPRLRMRRIKIRMLSGWSQGNFYISVSEFVCVDSWAEKKVREKIIKNEWNMILFAECRRSGLWRVRRNAGRILLSNKRCRNLQRKLQRPLVLRHRVRRLLKILVKYIFFFQYLWILQNFYITDEVSITVSSLSRLINMWF